MDPRSVVNFIQRYIAQPAATFPTPFSNVPSMNQAMCYNRPLQDILSTMSYAPNALVPEINPYAIQNICIRHGDVAWNPDSTLQITTLTESANMLKILHHAETELPEGTRAGISP